MPRTLAALVLALASCSNEADPVITPIDDLHSGATCPEGSDLRYESFGRAFFESHCLRCHSAAISGNVRQAPAGVNFDDVAAIRAAARAIDEQAGVGPDAEREIMPPSDPRPSREQREQLSEWLACGAP